MAWKETDLLERGRLNSKQVIRCLLDLDKRLSENTGSDTSIADAIGTESKSGTILYRIKSLETILGDADDNTVYDDSALAQRVATLEAFFSRNLSFTINDGSDPVQGAVVSIAGKTSSATGSSGGCTVNGVIDGTYEVTVTCEGYETYTGNKTVASDSTSFTISLTASS